MDIHEYVAWFALGVGLAGWGVAFKYLRLFTRLALNHAKLAGIVCDLATTDECERKSNVSRSEIGA